MTKSEVVTLIRETLESHFTDFADETELEEAAKDVTEQLSSVFDIYPDEEPEEAEDEKEDLAAEG